MSTQRLLNTHIFHGWLIYLVKPTPKCFINQDVIKEPFVPSVINVRIFCNEHNKGGDVVL